MPLFSSKFSPKKTPVRKAGVFLTGRDLSSKEIEKELGLEVGAIRLKLGDQEAIFEGGVWIPESGKVGGTFRENESLKKEVKRLGEENNLLKLKLELLVDMLTETTVEFNVQKDGMERLQKNSWNREIKS